MNDLLRRESGRSLNPSQLEATMERLPRELTEMVLLRPELRGLTGLLMQVCRHWKDLLTLAKLRPATALTELVRVVPLLQWAEAQPRCPTDWNVCFYAARGGHLDTVKWIWDRVDGYSKSTVPDAAAEGGHLRVLQWACDNGCNVHAWTCVKAAEYGRLEVLQWLCARAECSQYRQLAQTCAHAARNGHLEVLQWLRGKDCVWDASTCVDAAAGGHLEVLQWARANTCPWDTDVCGAAAEEGHLAVLQWCHDNGCPWDASTCARAALGNHLDVLQWAVAQGCPFTDETCDIAAAVGNLEVLQWARVNGCSWSRFMFTQGDVAATELVKLTKP
eukprot:m.392956 g.392956  ORF g.392956 m.392956 type:complete len:332 (-) comp16762_c1_seq1:180-1175(-)